MHVDEIGVSVIWALAPVIVLVLVLVATRLRPDTSDDDPPLSEEHNGAPQRQ